MLAFFKSLWIKVVSWFAKKQETEKPKVESDFIKYSLEWYAWKYENAKILLEYKSQVEFAINKIVKNKDRYAAIAKILKIPWEIVAAIHWRESSCNFDTCLHNGDPLPGPTVNVPKGRGPFSSWEDAAIDALVLEGISEMKQEERIGAWLKWIEAYNGLGYQKYHSEQLSPYIWAQTDACNARGYYTADGKYSSEALANVYPGCVAILKVLERHK